MDSPNRGRRGRRWQALKAQVRARRSPCFHCGQAIDYDATYPDPDCFTVDHLQSWRDHPDLREDPGNLVAAHARCNWVKGTGPAPLGLGNRSEEW